MSETEPKATGVEIVAGLYVNEPAGNDPPRLHQSLAHILVSRSPLHAWYKAFAEVPEEYTDATDRGQLAHALLLGGGEIVVVQANDWRTNAAKAERDAARANGKTPVLAHKLEEASIMTEKVLSQLQKRGIELTGESEATVIWQSPYGAWCQGRLDHFLFKSGTIWDFKFVQNASKKTCEASFINYGYDIQHAAYVEAIETIFPELAGRVKMLFLFIEVDPPHALRIMPVGGTMRTSGQWRWARACEEWKQYLNFYGKETPWPAYLDDGEAAECPPWALNAQIAEETIREGSNE